MRKTRAAYVMVDEDDPRWVKFWAAYEKRVAKKDARRAFAEINPPMELVDRMCAALAWQFQQHDWQKQDHQFAPYPASYLRAERWTDEAPKVALARPVDPLSAKVNDPMQEWLRRKQA